MDEAQTPNATAHSELNAAMSQLSVVNAIVDDSTCESKLSAFERLPGELFREIVQYVPESVFDLRLTSRASRCHVDEFAIVSANVQVVDLVMIKVIERRSSKEQEASTTITIGVRVPENKSKLFELRLRLAALAIGEGSAHLKSRIKRMKQEDLARKEYKIMFNLLKDAKLLEFLIDCCGRRIGTLLLIDFGDIQTFVAISKMLEKTRFRDLCCEISQLHDPIATQLLTVIRMNMVERIALTVRDNFCVDPAAVLVEIASHVRAIRIVTDADRSESPFTIFGIVDWAPVILAIFSANVDTLHLVGGRCGYFSLDAVEFLQERLPHLGKKLWFEAVANACRCTLKFGVNGHLFHLTPGSMSMKHWSRVKEPLW